MHLNTSLSNLSTCQQHMFCKKEKKKKGGEREREKRKKALPEGVMAPTRTPKMLWIQQISIAGGLPWGAFLQCLHFRNLSQRPLGASFHNAWKCRVILCAVPHGAFINTWILRDWKLHRDSVGACARTRKGEKLCGDVLSSLLFSSFSFHTLLSSLHFSFLLHARVK